MKEKCEADHVDYERVSRKKIVAICNKFTSHYAGDAKLYYY